MNYLSLSMILSSSLLILLVALLRRLLRGRVKLRLQYALWLLVALRLLLPFDIGSVNFSVRSVAPTEAVTQRLEQINLPLSPAAPPTVTAPENSDAVTDATSAPAAATATAGPSLGDILRLVWLSGVVLMSLWQLWANLRFARQLRRKAVPRPDIAARLPVWQADDLASPCLFGLFRPRIYLNRAAEDEQLRHILTHEQCHFYHGDHWWALLRAVCLSLHWFNPLVWWAAVLSRRDAELACDESVVEILGESQRRAYGETLLALISPGQPAKEQTLQAATTMQSGKQTMKERFIMLANKPKMKWYISIVLLLTVLLAAACAFGGCQSREEKPAAEVSEQAQQLFDARNEFAGDAAADSQLLQLVNVGEIGSYTIELFTDEQPYALQINFNDTFYSDNQPDHQMTMKSLLLLALIDNVDEIRWHYNVEDTSVSPTASGVFTGRLNAADASATLNCDNVKDYGQSAAQVQALLDWFSANNIAVIEAEGNLSKHLAERALYDAFQIVSNEQYSAADRAAARTEIFANLPLVVSWDFYNMIHPEMSVMPLPLLLDWLQQQTELSDSELLNLLSSGSDPWDGAYAESYAALVGQQFRADPGRVLSAMTQLDEVSRDALLPYLAYDLSYDAEQSWQQQSGLDSEQQAMLQLIVDTAAQQNK